MYYSVNNGQNLDFQNASHDSIEETVLVPLDHKDNVATVEGISNYYNQVINAYDIMSWNIVTDVYIEPHVVAHVQLRGELTPKIEEDVKFKVQESIARTAQIKSVSSLILQN